MSQSVSTKRDFWHRLLKHGQEKPEPEAKSLTSRNALRDGVAVVFLAFVCFLAVLQKMEILATIAMLCIGAIVYKRRAVKAIDAGLELVQRARVAKVGDFELTVTQRLKDYSQLLSRQAEWIRVIVSELTSEQIALLIAIYKAGRHEARDKDSLRALRARGLLFHNAPLMTESTEVWLSDLGKEVAASLIQPNPPQNVTAVEQSPTEEVE